MPIDDVNLNFDLYLSQDTAEFFFLCGAVETVEAFERVLPIREVFLKALCSVGLTCDLVPLLSNRRLTRSSVVEKVP